MWTQQFSLPLLVLLPLAAAAIPSAVADDNPATSIETTDTSLAFSILPVYPSTTSGASAPTPEPTTTSMPIGISSTASGQTTDTSTNDSPTTSTSEAVSSTGAETGTGATSASGTESAQPSQSGNSEGRQVRANSLQAAAGVVAVAIALI